MTSLSKKAEKVICRGKELQGRGRRKEWHGVATMNDTRAIIAGIRLWGKKAYGSLIGSYENHWE